MKDTYMIKSYVGLLPVFGHVSGSLFQRNSRKPLFRTIMLIQ